MIAVIDTNHLLRVAAAYRRSPLFAAWQVDRFKVVLSNEMMAELADVAARPKIRRFLDIETFKQFVALLEKWALFVTPAADFPHCRDPKDDMIISTAIAAHADYIVTTDRDLLDDAELRARLQDEWNIRVAEPAEFLAVLE